jgi:hypothetical protein
MNHEVHFLQAWDFFSAQTQFVSLTSCSWFWAKLTINYVFDDINVLDLSVSSEVSSFFSVA